MKNLFSIKNLLFIFILVFVLISCNSNQKNGNDFQNTDDSYKESEMIVLDETVTKDLVSTTDQSLTPPPPPPPESSSSEITDVTSDIDIEEKIIKTATISCELKDYEENKVLIDSVVSKFAGIISQENEYRNEWNISNTIKIRVPNENFDNLVKEVLLLATKVDSKIITIEDVTEQYVDVYTRLQTKKEVEQQYLEILKKAYTINDILNVNNYLRIIREEIEAQEGKLKFIDDQVSMSTINLSIYENFTQNEVKKNTFWKKIGDALIKGWNGVLIFVIGLFRIWPVLLILGIVIFLIVRKMRKTKIKSKSMQS
jgi:hypothetical protein